MKLGTVSFLVAVIAIFSIGVEVEAAADDTPSGLNPITYPLGGNVDAGSPVTITWQVRRLSSPESAPLLWIGLLTSYYSQVPRELSQYMH